MPDERSGREDLDGHEDLDGGEDLVKQICREGSLVPDATMERIQRSSEQRALVGTIERSGKSAPFKESKRGTTTAIPLTSLTT